MLKTKILIMLKINNLVVPKKRIYIRYVSKKNKSITSKKYIGCVSKTNKSITSKNK
jgi:hypothetical protein